MLSKRIVNYGLKTMGERRKFERFEVNVPARLEILTQEGQPEVIDLEASSLSAGGTLLISGRPVPAGSPVRIEVALKFEELKTIEDPEGTLVIAATGRVLRSGPEGMAIRFNEDYDITKNLKLIRKGN
ncbi:MAG: PilZ domain-containing protein [Deltaproteobacteria bacterium]|nr:PilZ domain-containing protein [Deltaproteobacteria bacterium]